MFVRGLDLFLSGSSAQCVSPMSYLAQSCLWSHWFVGQKCSYKVWREVRKHEEGLTKC